MLVKRNVAFRNRVIRDKNILIGNYKAYELNETGSLIWGMLDTKRSVDDICINLSEKYKVSPSDIKSDVESYIEFLLKIEALKKVGV